MACVYVCHPLEMGGEREEENLRNVFFCPFLFSWEGVKVNICFMGISIHTYVLEGSGIWGEKQDDVL